MRNILSILMVVWSLLSSESSFSSCWSEATHLQLWRASKKAVVIFCFSLSIFPSSSKNRNHCTQCLMMKRGQVSSTKFQWSPGKMNEIYRMWNVVTELKQTFKVTLSTLSLCSLVFVDPDQRRAIELYGTEFIRAPPFSLGWRWLAPR